jgi:hypothetical protein
MLSADCSEPAEGVITGHATTSSRTNCTGASASAGFGRGTHFGEELFDFFHRAQMAYPSDTLYSERVRPLDSRSKAIVAAFDVCREAHPDWWESSLAWVSHGMFPVRSPCP